MWNELFRHTAYHLVAIGLATGLGLAYGVIRQYPPIEIYAFAATGCLLVLIPSTVRCLRVIHRLSATVDKLQGSIVNYKSLRATLKDEYLACLGFVRFILGEVSNSLQALRVRIDEIEANLAAGLPMTAQQRQELDNRFVAILSLIRRAMLDLSTEPVDSIRLYLKVSIADSDVLVLYSDQQPIFAPHPGSPALINARKSTRSFVRWAAPDINVFDVQAKRGCCGVFPLGQQQYAMLCATLSCENDVFKKHRKVLAAVFPILCSRMYRQYLRLESITVKQARPPRKQLRYWFR